MLYKEPHRRAQKSLERIGSARSVFARMSVCMCVEEHILDRRSAEPGLYWRGGRQNGHAFLPSEWGRSLLPFSKASRGAQRLFPLPGGTGPESLWRRLLGLSPKGHLSFRDMEWGSQLLQFQTVWLGQGVVAWIPLRPPRRQRNTEQGSRHSLVPSRPWSPEGGTKNLFWAPQLPRKCAWPL